MPHHHEAMPATTSSSKPTTASQAEREARLAADLKDARPVLEMNRRNTRAALAVLKKPKK